LATGTVEEKIFQRQLSKEGLQSVVDDKEQVNALSTKDLRNLFKLRAGTPSDTHDKLRCQRCKIIQDNAELEAIKVVPKQLKECASLLEEMCSLEDSQYFLEPLDPEKHNRSKEDYLKVVKQPMDLGTIRKRLALSGEQGTAYKKISEFAKDVNRIFSNVVKLWEPDEALSVSARTLQTWWLERWTSVVPKLMCMKATDEETATCDTATTSMEVEHDTNDRGDDYQEQIGMPDEENMRQWSHHHTTDTVDDPVFRAAMRGCDAVSFVFGLEVTWSLIQQRQQEEEERLALQELGSENEDEADDATSNPLDDASDDDCMEVERSVKGEHIDDSMEVEEGPMVEQIDDSEDSDDSTDENIPIRNKNVLRGDEASSPDPKPHAETIFEVDVASASESGDTPIKAEILGESPLKAEAVAQESRVEVASSKEWSCSVCTLLNSFKRKSCSACGTKRG